MYVHNSLPVSDVVTHDKGRCEAVMGTLSSINTILVTLYRPPGTSDEMFRELLLAVQQHLDNAMDRKHHDIYIMGEIMGEILTSLPLIRRPLLMTTARAKSEVLFQHRDCSTSWDYLSHPNR